MFHPARHSFVVGYHNSEWSVAGSQRSSILQKGEHYLLVGETRIKLRQRNHNLKSVRSGSEEAGRQALSFEQIAKPDTRLLKNVLESYAFEGGCGRPARADRDVGQGGNCGLVEDRIDSVVIGDGDLLGLQEATAENTADRMTGVRTASFMWCSSCQRVLVLLRCA